MNYTFHFETKHSESISAVGKDDPVDIVFKYIPKEEYPQLIFKDLDLVEVLNKAKNKFFSLYNANSVWDSFEETLLYKKEKDREKNIPAHQVHKCAYKRDNKFLFNIINRFAINEPETQVSKINLRSKKIDLIAIEESQKKYNAFLPILTSELKKTLKKKKKSEQFEIYYQQMITNLPSLIKKMINFEHSLLKTSDYKVEKQAFNNVYKIIYPALSMMYANKKYDTLDEYKFEIGACSEKFKEDRENIDDFVPVGMCYFNEKLFINTSSWKSNGKTTDKKYNIEKIKGVFLHELGHAIDLPSDDAPLLRKNDVIDAEQRISHTDDFAKYTKQNYKNSRKLKSRHREYIEYYCYPQVHIIDQEECDVNKDKATLYYDWSRAQSESWAESFAILSKWIIYGMSKADTVVLKGRCSSQRIEIKTLMPTIRYMLDNLNWEYIGIPKELFERRKKLVKKILNKIDTIPICFKKEDPRYLRKIGRLNGLPKPNIKMLVK